MMFLDNGLRDSLLTGEIAECLLTMTCNSVLRCEVFWGKTRSTWERRDALLKMLPRMQQ